MTDDHDSLPARDRLELLRREEEIAQVGRNRKMNELIRSTAAMQRAKRRSAGPPGRDVVQGMRDRLRIEHPDRAGYKSVAEALQAEGYEISERTVRRRLAE